jgi:hypothetical protein
VRRFLRSHQVLRSFVSRRSLLSNSSARIDPFRVCAVDEGGCQGRSKRVVKSGTDGTSYWLLAIGFESHVVSAVVG